MSLYLVWMALYAFFGHPLVALGIVLAIAWVIGRRTFFPSRPKRWFARLRRERQLRAQIAQQDWNRAARFELADWLRERRRFGEAAAILAPNLALDDDDDTLFVMGVASFGSGDVARGEELLGRLVARNPKFKTGEALLELGRWRLQHGNADGAIDALERFVAQRQSTVEGRTLLALAHARRGDEPRARALRAEAWAAFRHAPRFLKRSERYWAYRAKPLRGVVWVGAAAAIAVGGVVLVTLALGAARQASYVELPRQAASRPCRVTIDNTFVGRYALAPSQPSLDLDHDVVLAGTDVDAEVVAEIERLVALEVESDRVIYLGQEVCFDRLVATDDRGQRLVADLTWPSDFAADVPPAAMRIELARDGELVRVTLASPASGAAPMQTKFRPLD